MSIQAVLLMLLHAVDSAAPVTACTSGYLERYEPRSFLGYACTGDCERHKAGFAWAVRKRVRERADCAVLPAAEAEGCRAWVEEHLTEEAAGYRWALENEVTSPCLCEGAGTGFRMGCLRQLTLSGQLIPRSGRGSTTLRESGESPSFVGNDNRPGSVQTPASWHDCNGNGLFDLGVDTDSVVSNQASATAQ